MDDINEWSESPKESVGKWFESAIDSNDDWTKIRIWLINEIKYLIAKNPEKLLHILYRIDIDENKAMAALSQNNASELLTDLIIARQIQKEQSRREHK